MSEKHTPGYFNKMIDELVDSAFHAGYRTGFKNAFILMGGFLLMMACVAAIEVFGVLL